MRKDRPLSLSSGKQTLTGASGHQLIEFGVLEETVDKRNQSAAILDEAAAGIHYRIIAAGIDLAEVAVTLTDHGFPDLQLCCYGVSQLIAALVLGAPVQRDRTGIAVLQDTTNEDLDFIGTDSAVQFRRVIVPKVFILSRKGIAGILRNTGFNTVADVSFVGVHSADIGIVGLPGTPAIHIVQIGMTPIRRRNWRRHREESRSYTPLSVHRQQMPSCQDRGWSRSTSAMPAASRCLS